jgi:hypothetical protein
MPAVAARATPSPVNSWIGGHRARFAAYRCIILCADLMASMARSGAVDEYTIQSLRWDEDVSSDCNWLGLTHRHQFLIVPALPDSR